MNPTEVPAKSRSKLWLIIVGVGVIGVGVYVAVHWTSFKEGFKQGYAAGSKK